MVFRYLSAFGAVLAGLISASPALSQDQSAPAAAPAAARRAELWNTEQFTVHSTILERDLLIQVVKPLSPPQGRIPAVYMVDGNLYTSFAINPMVGAFTGEYAPAFFIGVGYPEQSPLQWVRQRATDLLHQPNVDVAGPDYPYMEGVQSGGGVLFQRFLTEELRPLVEARYAIDRNRTVLAGISYGGLFTTRVMLDDPTAFSAYLIGSPSIDVEPGLVARARTVQLRRGTQVYVSAGGSEEAEHLANARALAAALRENPAGAAVTEWIVPDEGHVGFAPAFFGRALRTVLPPEPRRKSGAAQPKVTAGVQVAHRSGTADLTSTGSMRGGHMKPFLFIVLGSIAASPAAAQRAQPSPYFPSSEIGSPRYSAALTTREDSAGRSPSLSGDGRECLREVRTQRLICRTRFEWERIAARLARGESWR